jgi:diadenylate cyclase
MSFLRSLTASLPEVTLTSAIDILLVALLVYQALVIVRGTRAWHILLGILTIGAIYYLSAWFRLDALHRLLAQAVPYAGFAIIVLFQSEIRRTLARIGRRRLFGWGYRRAEATEDILLAINRLSHEKTGALIVMERDIGLRTFIESGVRLDAHMSRDLLLSIFYPGGALHDGAVIVQKDLVAAAACFLPLSTNPAISSKLGTRHRAAIGITEETDCLSIVVSEETGRISIAAFGEVESGLTIHEVEERVAAHFGNRKFRRRTADGVPPLSSSAQGAEKVARR